jgi:hypothetical protein
MKNDNLRQIFKSLCFPKKKLKTIKLKRFVKEMNPEVDFTDLDIFIAGEQDNYSDRKLGFGTFERIVEYLVHKGQLTLALISEKFEETLSEQEE